MTEYFSSSWTFGCLKTLAPPGEKSTTAFVWSDGENFRLDFQKAYLKITTYITLVIFWVINFLKFPDNFLVILKSHLDFGKWNLELKFLAFMVAYNLLPYLYKSVWKLENISEEQKISLSSCIFFTNTICQIVRCSPAAALLSGKHFKSLLETV